MEILPAIDILAGRCVRLRQGDYARVSDYGTPADAARRFAKAGAKWLHIVDLDGARTGQIQNQRPLQQVAQVCRDAGIQFQVGGGIRDAAAAQAVFNLGANRVALGTAALRDAAFRERVVAEFPGQIVLALDARNGELAAQGWRENSGVNIADFIAELRANPPAAILHTDIARDGVLSGVNLSQTRQVARIAPCPVIASGGVNSEADLRGLAEIPNLLGAIVGRAFYDGAMDAEKILRAATRETTRKTTRETTREMADDQPRPE